MQEDWRSRRQVYVIFAPLSHLSRLCRRSPRQRIQRSTLLDWVMISLKKWSHKSFLKSSKENHNKRLLSLWYKSKKPSLSTPLLGMSSLKETITEPRCTLNPQARLCSSIWKRRRKYSTSYSVFKEKLTRMCDSYILGYLIGLTT